MFWSVGRTGSCQRFHAMYMALEDTTSYQCLNPFTRFLVSYLADWKVSMQNIAKTGNLTHSELAFRFSFNESRSLYPKRIFES